MQRREMGHIADPAVVATLTARLREREHFRAVAAPSMEQFLRCGSLVELVAGETLIREGAVSTGEFYLLLDGSLVVKSGPAFIARLDRPGDVVGEVAVLMASRRTADVRAESRVQAVALPSSLIQQPEFADITAGIRSAMLRDDWAQY